MEIQNDLFNYNKRRFKQKQELTNLEVEPRSLENEKSKFLVVLCQFIDSVDFGKEDDIEIGRPKKDIHDLIKSLCVMAYNGMSYRRANSDFNDLFEKKLINHIPTRSTLNRLICSEDTNNIISRLIQMSALLFIDSEDTLICDSTWLSHHMYGGGYKIVYDKEHAPLDKCTKLHIGCLKNSKVIACAITTKGTSHDSPIFKKLVMHTVRNGFFIKNLLADAGYSSKDNYSFCNNLNIKNIFIDFQKRVKFRSQGKTAWMRQMKIFKEDQELWHEKYRFRVVVEGIFSCIKKKHINYLRSRKSESRENELMLKALVYNLTVIGRYF